MNGQKIKELMKQALDYGELQSRRGENLTINEQAAQLSEKFAELIVQECADWIESQDEAEHPTAWLLCDELKEHFGVE